VYGVARHVPAIAHPGIVGADVSAIQHAGLVAIVSAVPSIDVRAKRHDLLAHQEVLQEAFAAGTVVPLRFGTVFDDAAAVVSELLEPSRGALLRLLERFDGVAELNVRARYDEEAVLREIVRDDPRVRRLREARGADVALGEAVVSALRAKRAADAARIEAVLARIAADVVIEEPRAEYELFRGAFLVERDEVNAFDAAMNELARAREGCVVFKYFGPLPPHSFVGHEGLGA
jgi:hypothetical protein